MTVFLMTHIHSYLPCDWDFVHMKKMFQLANVYCKNYSKNTLIHTERCVCVVCVIYPPSHIVYGPISIIHWQSPSLFRTTNFPIIFFLFLPGIKLKSILSLLRQRFKSGSWKFFCCYHLDVPPFLRVILVYCVSFAPFADISN